VRKFDTVHENETGYILLLASVVGNNHHASETGFFPDFKRETANLMDSGGKLRMNIAAFDIGGTALKMGVMTREGTLLEKGKQNIVDSDGDQILQAMLAWIAAHPACEGVAISAPGYVNPHTGFIEMGGAIRKFDNFAIKRWLEQQVRLPVAIENDANCVLLAERWRGKAADMSNFLVLTIGTGIGGAIFCNNQLVHGALPRRRVRLYANRASGHPRCAALFDE
jgi:beta-glucoside kinase